MARLPASLVRAASWWRARSTRVRLRILVATVGILGLVLRDLLLLVSAGLALLVAETMTRPAARPRPMP
ncbi:MAG TPA: hypothetical protein VI997_04195 [Candidatus Thermoplasmatota archaeon]|nr:hypothetical protein [Candidatus Thermoplasmatota archaeon]